MNPPVNKNRDNLEAWLDAQLRQLPDRPAPASLAPRVMTALAARAHRPWYARPWLEWPRYARAMSLLAVSFVLGALTYATLHFSEFAAAGTVGARLNVWLAPLEAIWAAGLAVCEALGLLKQQVSVWVWIGLGALGTLMYAVCVGLGTVLYRLAFHKSEAGREHEKH